MRAERAVKAALRARAHTQFDSASGIGYSLAMPRMPHPERHRTERAGWLRAAVLGADDAIVSTTSLMIGVAASSASTRAVLIAGTAGVVAGALSMAAGEYVSVSSQRDIETAEIARERRELATQPQSELSELTSIYERRGLDHALAHQVAIQLSQHDQLAAHLRDELGIDQATRAQPLLAGAASAGAFLVFGCLPIASIVLAPAALQVPVMATTALLSLAALGAVGAQLGGAPIARAALRVCIGGALAMSITALVGRLFGVAVS